MDTGMGMDMVWRHDNFWKSRIQVRQCRTQVRRPDCCTCASHIHPHMIKNFARKSTNGSLSYPYLITKLLYELHVPFHIYSFGPHPFLLPLMLVPCISVLAICISHTTMPLQGDTNDEMLIRLMKRYKVRVPKHKSSHWRLTFSNS